MSHNLIRFWQQYVVVDLQSNCLCKYDVAIFLFYWQRKTSVANFAIILGTRRGHQSDIILLLQMTKLLVGYISPTRTIHSSVIRMRDCPARQRLQPGTLFYPKYQTVLEHDIYQTKSHQNIHLCKVWLCMLVVYIISGTDLKHNI
jgi:hypothetical protein